MKNSLHPMFVFNTPWRSSFYDSYHECHNAKDLKKYLSRYDFSAPSVIHGYSGVLPEFRLGTKYDFTINGYDFKSGVKWGPRFLFARDIRLDGKRIFINVPMDASVSDADGVDVPRVWQWMPFHHGMADAVIDLYNLRQLWPKCEESRSELNKFLSRMSRERLSVRVR